MGDALDRLRVLLARTFVARHKRVTAEGTIEDVESHWRELPASVRKTFKESMHAPSVQGGQSHPFDKPDTTSPKDMPPGQRAVYEAVQHRVGERKAEALKAKVGDQSGRKAGYLKSGGKTTTNAGYAASLKTTPSSREAEKRGRSETAFLKTVREMGFAEDDPAVQKELAVVAKGGSSDLALDRLRAKSAPKKGTFCSVCGQTLHPSLKKGQWAHSKKSDHAPKPVPSK